MKKILFCIIIVCFSSPYLFSQEVNITGLLKDTVDNKTLEFGTILLLNKEDSTLVKYVRSKKDGKFQLSVNKPGTYILQISYPKYVDFSEEYNIDTSEMDLGIIPLIQKAHLLSEVVVYADQSIRLKGDTTEYLADKFQVRDGANVEELFKKLPGFQIDAKGNITAHGQRVDKVMVDGEEFFGDDPTIATQNIAAKAVKKVQVYDNNSEQDKLMGSKTANQGKVVNIQLKEEYKKGSFGKLSAGSDFGKHTEAKGLYNNFSNNRKLSVFSTKSNINNGGLDDNERNRMGFERDADYDIISGFYSVMGENDEFTDHSMSGIPDALTIGGLFANKWMDGKHSVNGNYKFNQLNTNNNSLVLTQNILPDQVLFSENTGNTLSQNRQHSVNARYNLKIDSLTDIKVIAIGKQKISENLSNNDINYRNNFESLLNSNSQHRRSEKTDQTFDNQAQLTKKFARPNRILQATFRIGINHSDQEGFIYAKRTIFEDNNIVSDSISDQKKDILGKSNTYSSRIIYSEPLTKKLSLIGSYGLNINNSTSTHKTFNSIEEGKYTVFDSLFSSDFRLNAISNNSMLALKYQGQKLNISAGAGVSGINFKLTDNNELTTNTYRFTNFTPYTNMFLKGSKQNVFILGYRGTTVQPNLNLLQPLRNNNDPLNIFIGNPNLRIGFRHDIYFAYQTNKLSKGSHFYSSVNYNSTSNGIVNSSTVDKNGARRYTPVNTNGVYAANIYVGAGSKLKNKKFYHQINFSAGFGNNVEFINMLRNNNNYLNANLNYRINYDIENKLYLSASPSIGYNSSNSSFQNNINNNFFTYGGGVDANYNFPKGFFFSTGINFNLRQKIEAFTQNANIINWGASAGKTLFKDKSGRVFLQANDILNQNTGYSRVINSSFVTDSYNSAISRFIMLRFEWSFNSSINK